MGEITRIVGLDELVPDTRAGKRATAARREARRVAGEASRAASAATLDARTRAHVAKRGDGKGWRNPSNQIAMAPPKPAPGGSWWLGLPREAFASQAAEEQARMQRHKFGATSTAVVEDAS